MDNLIQWPKASWWDKAWNTWIGCRKVSPACDHCWACGWAKRFKKSFEPHPTPKNPPKSGVVFVGSLTDAFGEWKSREEMGEEIAHCVTRWDNKSARYVWLTKRPERMIDALHYVSDRLKHPAHWFKYNYFGFTAENQEWYDKRLGPMLESIPSWANTWVSVEPLLGPLNLRLDDIDVALMLDGVIVGCESGAGRRPCNIEWVESIVEQCMSAKVPVFVKQLSINNKCETDISKFPAHLQIRQVPWADSEKGAKE